MYYYYFCYAHNVAAASVAKLHYFNPLFVLVFRTVHVNRGDYTRKGNKITAERTRTAITLQLHTRLAFTGRTWYAFYAFYDRLAAVDTNGPYVTRLDK